MEFLKKHFEKIVLSAVLLGLGAAAYWLSVAVQDAQRDMGTVLAAPGPPKAWVELNLKAERAALEALHNPPHLVWSGEHNLFNPTTWKERRDGSWFKVLKEGPGALAVTDIRPLNFIINFLRRSGDGFNMSVQHDSGTKVAGYAYIDQKEKNRPYIIRGTEGPTNDPTGILLDIPDEPAKVLVTKEKPYQRVESYEADLKYDPDSLVLQRRRVSTNEFILSLEPYKIIAITNNAVTVQNTRTTQKTTIQWTNAPARTNP